jgi:hypothetical protein
VKAGTMIIDIHYHLMNKGWDPEKLFSSATKLITKTYGSLSAKQIENMFSALWDPTGEKAIKFMDEAGILGGNAQKLLGL